jgi:hypothetical protein
MENTEESDKTALEERGMHQKTGAFLNEEWKAKFNALRHDYDYSYGERIFERAKWIVVEFGYVAHEGVLCVDYMPASSESKTIDEMCGRLGMPRPSRG